MKSARIFLSALLVLSTSISAVLAQYQRGQTVYTLYVGKYREARVLKQDSYGVLIEWRNALTGKWDQSGTMYKPAAELLASKPPQYDPREYGNELSVEGGDGYAAALAAQGAAPAQPQSYAPSNGYAQQPASQPSSIFNAVNGTVPVNNTAPGLNAPTTPAQVQHHQATTGGTAGSGVRIGKYQMRAFSSTYSYQAQNVVGWFELHGDGTYSTSHGGSGTYSTSGGGIQWLSGPYQRENYLGIVRDDGRTTRVVLTRNERGADRMVAFCSQ